jgi:hypothetical protein
MEQNTSSTATAETPKAKRPNRPTAKLTVETKTGEVGRAKDGHARYGFVILDGTEKVRESGCSYKTEEAARKAGEASLNS